MGSTTSSTLPSALKQQWWIVVTLFGLVGIGTILLFAKIWHPTAALQWGAAASGPLIYLLGYTRFHLSLNRADVDTSVMPRLGLGNGLTLLRGLLYGLLAGFVVLPQPTGVWAWVPGALYTVAALTDLADGRLARRRGETTRLGAKLDVEVDSVGVLAAVILAVRAGQLPLVFLAVGGLFYTYRLCLWWRRRRGKRIYPLPADPWRSKIGGFQVGFLCVVLWPVFAPPLTTFGGFVLLVPLLGSFLRDGLVATGRLDPRSEWYRAGRLRLRRWALERLPVLLRTVVGVTSVVYLATFAGADVPSAFDRLLAVGTVAAGLTVAAGVGAWMMPLALLVTGAFASLRLGVSPALIILVIGGLTLMLTGPGPYTVQHRRDSQ